MAVLWSLSNAAHADGTAPPASAPSALQTVIVTSTAENESNYRIPTLDTVGPLGSAPLVDQPYSISILPQDLIENSQATNFKEASKYLPLVYYQEQQGPDILRPQTRGMQGGNFQNTKIDGMTMFITVAMAMEQFERLEVVNGLSSFLYGPANPAGMFNFISKRPTAEPLHELTATYTSDSIFAAKMDFGGPIDSNGVVRYRLNALVANGDGYVDLSHQHRAMGDLGIDVHPWQNGVLELNYSNYTLTNLGFPGWFTYNEKIALPPAPDPQRVGYGQSYAGVSLRTVMESARFKQELNSNWRLVVGVLNQDASRDINTPVNNLTNNNGDYTSSFANGFAPRFAITSDVGYLNGDFDTFGIGNDFVFGTAGYKARSWAITTPATAASVLLGKASISDPQIFPEPPQGPPNVLLNYNSSIAYQQGVNVGDTLRFSERWQARVAASMDWFSTDNYNAHGAQLPSYSDQGASPSASLIYKPRADMTAYFTYASALQAGDLAPGTAVNAGQSLPPYRSTQYELGYKASLLHMDFTAALFQIERPFANINALTNVFEISGQQVNRGLELSAIGQAAPGLTVVGGLTLLNAVLEDTPLPSTNDKQYVGSPKVRGNVLLEYSLPQVPGLVTSFDYQFSGTRPGNDTNSFTVAGYNLFDVGVRYNSQLFGSTSVWRLAVNNVTDRNYYSTISPSNLTGTNTGNLIAHLGSPRLLLASLSIYF